MADLTTASLSSNAEYEIKNTPLLDVEQRAVAEAHLMNTTVSSISWRNVTVTVKDKKTKASRALVECVSGYVEAGEICALMGPSGSGKTTLLTALASRTVTNQKVQGEVKVNGSRPSKAAFRRMSCFVEQEDALIGSLTVRETLHFASRLASSSSLPNRERLARIDTLLDSFGLQEQADTIIGTPIRKGISGGQKRRVGVASQLITSPRILFLDEPTSGLDSAASWEVVNYLKGVARRNKLIVIASIHQPSTSTFNLFDKTLLLSSGRTHFFGPGSELTSHYSSLGYQVPYYVNPAEFVLELINIDFAPDRVAAAQQLHYMQQAWIASPRNTAVVEAIDSLQSRSPRHEEVADVEGKPGMPSLVLTLLHRSFIKSYRDVVAYGIRLAMYLGLAVMMGTVWLRLSADQASIIPLTNAIFYGSAFMSFMAVAYVPSFLEDRLQFVKEHQNGLYGATELIISNFFIGVPYLFLIAILFSVISYWLSNFQPTASAFFTWVLWLFLDLLAAEGLVVFFTSLFPSFVISLALVAFANGLWMSVNGFMVQPTIMNGFYKYVFHYWDYQKYVFENMMINEFHDRTYKCAMTGPGPNDCQCMWKTDLADQCLIQGQGVLDQYGFKPGYMAKDIGIMMAIIFGYRVAAWAVLRLRT